jgi:hypothetical protein
MINKLPKNYYKSGSRLEFKQKNLERIIKNCINTKQEIIQNTNQLKKQLTKNKKVWKSVEDLFSQNTLQTKSRPSHKNEEIHQKFQEICNNRNLEKEKKLSKLLVFNKNNQITDKDISTQEALKFLAANKRKFGSPLSNISIKPKRSDQNRKSMDFDCNLEESILRDIYAMKSKPISLEKSFSVAKPAKLFLKVNDFEEKISEMNSRNKFIYSEMKKLDPLRPKPYSFNHNSRSSLKLNSTRKTTLQNIN